MHSRTNEAIFKKKKNVTSNHRKLNICSQPYQTSVELWH